MSSENIDSSDNLGHRLRNYRKILGVNGSVFASIIGISQGSLSDIETNKTKPSTKTLAGLIRNTDINIEWLLTGEGKERTFKKVEENFFSELQDWAKEMSGSDNIDWLKRQIETTFPVFKKWKEGKEESTRENAEFPSSRVA
jgi:transcriptional regulator with XRE-family HTH domain